MEGSEGPADRRENGGNRGQKTESLVKIPFAAASRMRATDPAGLGELPGIAALTNKDDYYGVGYTRSLETGFLGVHSGKCFVCNVYLSPHTATCGYCNRDYSFCELHKPDAMFVCTIAGCIYCLRKRNDRLVALLEAMAKQCALELEPISKVDRATGTGDVVNLLEQLYRQVFPPVPGQ